MAGLAWHFVLGSAVVASLLWGAAQLARRYGGRGLRWGADEPLRVVARRQLGKATSLVRVSVEDRDLLLGASPKGVELICELPKTAAPEADVPAIQPLPLLFHNPGRTDFSELLASAIGLRRRRQ